MFDRRRSFLSRFDTCFFLGEWRWQGWRIESPLPRLSSLIFCLYSILYSRWSTIMSKLFLFISVAVAMSGINNFSHAGQYVVLGDNTKAGAWILRVDANQNVTVEKLENVVIVPTDGGPTVPPPTPPPLGLAGQVSVWAAAINDPETAEKLAVGYATVADQIKLGRFSSKAQVVKAQNAVNKLLTSGDNWQPFFDNLATELSKREAAGEMNSPADMEDEWRAISKGLKVSGLDKINWEKLIELILLIINLITSLG